MKAQTKVIVVSALADKYLSALAEMDVKFHEEHKDVVDDIGVDDAVVAIKAAVKQFMKDNG